MKKIKGILVHTRKGISPVDLEYEDYTSIVELLECNYITRVVRKIGGQIVDVWCDEEALLKPAREPSIITRKHDTRAVVEVLLGNCFICSSDNNGEIKSLKKSAFDPILLTQGSITTTERTYQVLQAEM